MSLDKRQSVFSYKSVFGGLVYYFDIAVDQFGDTNLRNVQDSRGLVIDSMTNIPQKVVDDVNTAIGQVRNVMATTSSINGYVSFSNETTKSVSFGSPMMSDGYRVYLNIGDLVLYKITNKTLGGFTIELSAEFTGNVYYDVFV